jgi:hypothetical protein
MDNERKETRRTCLSIFMSLISIVCFFACGGAAYSQTGAGFYGNPGNSGSWQRPAPSRPPPARPRPAYWFFPGPTPNYLAGVYDQFGSFAGLIGPAVNTGFNTTVDLMYGGLEVTVAYGSGGYLGLPSVPASDFSPLMAQYDRTVKCEGQEVADQTYTTSNVINGLVTEAVGAAQHSLTVDGSTALMDWWANFSGGTLGGAIATAPIGALPWRVPTGAGRPRPIRRPGIVVEPELGDWINGQWVPTNAGRPLLPIRGPAIVIEPDIPWPSAPTVPVGGSAPPTALIPRPSAPLLPGRPPLLLPGPTLPGRELVGRPSEPGLPPNVFTLDVINPDTGLRVYQYVAQTEELRITIVIQAVLEIRQFWQQFKTEKFQCETNNKMNKLWSSSTTSKFGFFGGQKAIRGGHDLLKDLHIQSILELASGSASWYMIKYQAPGSGLEYHFAYNPDLDWVFLHYFDDQRPPKIK